MKIHCDNCNRWYPEEYYTESYLEEGLKHGWVDAPNPYKYLFTKTPEYGNSKGWREFSLEGGVPWKVNCKNCSTNPGGL